MQTTALKKTLGHYLLEDLKREKDYPKRGYTPDQLNRLVFKSSSLEHINICLSPRETKAIMLRFGSGGVRATLEDVGWALGVTRERTRQIILKAIQKLAYHPVFWSKILGIDKICDYDRRADGREINYDLSKMVINRN